MVTESSDKQDLVAWVTLDNKNSVKQDMMGYPGSANPCQTKLGMYAKIRETLLNKTLRLN